MSDAKGSIPTRSQERRMIASKQQRESRPDKANRFPWDAPSMRRRQRNLGAISFEFTLSPENRAC